MHLKENEIIGIFPEGGRSPDGKIKKGKPGVAILALSTKVPVVPVGFVNTQKVLPMGSIIPRPARCEVNIGEPLKFENYYKNYDKAIQHNNQIKKADIEEKVVRIIMQDIARLSNQEYPY